jgi:Yip1 domain
MQSSLAALLELARYTVQNPRAAARYLLALQLPENARWLMFLLVATASAILMHIGISLLPTAEQIYLANAMSSPLRSAAMQAAFLLLTVVGVYSIGRWRGGTGSFTDTLLLVSWLQFVLLCLQAVQILALIILPPVAEILGVVGLGLSFWLLTQFVVELHGFSSALRVFLVMIGVLFAAAMMASILIVAIVGTGS